jgi:uncharacterized membrane protein YfcA
VAGGGSFLSFPALLSLGLLPITANATNTVALWPGQVASALAFRSELRKNTRLLLPVAGGAAVGGVTGALLLLRTGQQTFAHLVPWLLLVASLLFWASGPVSQWLRKRAAKAGGDRIPAGGEQPPPLPSRWGIFFALAFVAIYIGYFGAGAGFLIMSAIGLLGVTHLHENNALKVVAAGVANGVAAATFILRGAVAWRYCLVAMVLAALGGYLGARISRRIQGPVLRGVIVALGLSMSAYFFLRP